MNTNQTILETKRLVLRKWTNADADALFELLHDRDVVRYIADGQPFSMEKTKQFLIWAENYERENGFCRWKVIEKSSGKIIESCGFARMESTQEIDFGYLFAKNYWGKGFATEIAKPALDYGFEKLGFREIIGKTHPNNFASQKVLEKIGFTKRGIEIYDNE